MQAAEQVTAAASDRHQLTKQLQTNSLAIFKKLEPEFN